MTAQRTAVYRFFDASGGLLYVGMTSDLMTRWRWHEKNAEWWPDQARIEVVWHADRDAADAEETLAIRSEGTKMNVQKRGKTPLKSIRLSDDLWDEFGMAAAAVDLTKTDVLKQFIRWYAGDPDVALPQRPSKDLIVAVTGKTSAA